ncbi:Rqc2 family fibronectin-binding protein [Clostridium sp. DL1XJH146]
MAFDGFFLRSIIDNVKDYLIDSKVDKINQPEKDEIILTCRKGRINKKLLISASSNYPRIHFSEINKKNPMKAPMFCMVLRKYLKNSKIIEIKQYDNDRIISMHFVGTDELGFNSEYILFIEIMGRHSNITLVRERDNIIMDSVKHLTPDINSVRIILPGQEYNFPPKTNKLNPFDFSKEQFEIKINECPSIDEFFYLNNFSGISKNFSKEIFTRLDNFNRKDLFNSSKNFFSTIENSKDMDYIIYSKEGIPKDFYCIYLETYNDYDTEKFDSPSELLEYYYQNKDMLDRIKSKSSSIQKIINNNIHRCTKKEKILNKELETCLGKNKYQLYGELLTANIYSLNKGLEEISLLNYYDENGSFVTIELDKYKTPSENIQKYFKKYNKLKKTEVAAKEQLIQNDEELNYLYSVLTSLKNLTTYDEVDEIKQELVLAGYIRKTKAPKKKNKSISEPMHFISSNNIDIYVGKNNIQNDYLTLKFASKNDIWLHTKQIPGSHVIIKNSHDITDKTIEEAANLAAYYSKASTSTKVPVDYTQVKNIKKPNGSKPGMVIYSTNKTVYIDPHKPNIKQNKSS